MTGTFAAYQLLMSLLIGLAALTAEPFLIRWRRPRRYLWTGALSASLLFPLAMSLGSAPRLDTAGAVPTQQPIIPMPSLAVEHRELGTAPAALGALEGIVPSAAAAESSARPGVSIERIVRITWPASSIAVWLLYLMGVGRLLVVTRACPTVSIGGVDTRLTENLGPAVFGVWRPVILWPRWLQTAPPRMRRAALAHELEHLRSRDPLLLASAMLMVSLAPWNALLWWQFKRLRFAAEADCDARVVGHSASASGYAEVLWRIGRRRKNLHATLAMGMSTHTWLERRIRLLLERPHRLSAWRAAWAIPITLVLLMGAAWVRAPSLAATPLRKLPPQDTRPAAGWAIAVARAQFPHLLQRPFRGTAVIAVVFDRDGHLKLVSQRRFAPGTPPTDFDMSLENGRLGIDPQEDVIERGSEGGNTGPTIGPWLASRNPGRVFIVYEVLKWMPDPTRRSDRVLSALKAYAPALFVKLVAGALAPTTLGAVFMDNDGKVMRLEQKTIPAGRPFTTDWPALFSAMGLSTQQPGRTGFLMANRGVFVEYAWSRRADDAPDVVQLDPAWRASWSDASPARQDTADDPAILQRYFPDIAQRGRAAACERIDGATVAESPWILFGRDGRVWGTGRWHNDLKQWNFGTAAIQAIEARYPGALVAYPSGATVWRVHGVPITALWIAPDSPVQSQDQVHWSEQRQLLVTGHFLLRVHDRPPGATGPTELPLGFAAAMNFSSAAYTGGLPQDPLMMVQAGRLGSDEVLLSVRFTVCGIDKGVHRAGDGCLQSAQVRAHYDTPVDIPLTQDAKTQAMYARIVVRVQRLRA